MVEELKVLAEVLQGVTNGAVIGVSVYLLIDLLKIVAIGYFSFASVKVIMINMFKPSTAKEISDEFSK